MDLNRYIEAMRRFYEREGYYPAFGKPRRRCEQESPEEEAQQPTQQRVIPHSRRRPWK